MNVDRRVRDAAALCALGALLGCTAAEAPTESARPEAREERAASTQPAAPAAATQPTSPSGGEGGPAADRLEIVDARARAMPPSAANSAAFMTLRNSGPAAALVEAKADVSETVELHTHTHVDGVMKMRRLPKIPLPAGADTVLEPGGLHVMLIGLRDPLVAGQRFDLTLVFEDASQKTVEVEVRSIEPPRASP